MVVALIDDENVTLKKYYPEGGMTDKDNRRQETNNDFTILCY